MSSSLSDLKNRSEKVAGRGQILTILKANSCSIGQKSGEIWTGQTLLQPISFKSDKLLDIGKQVYGGKNEQPDHVDEVPVSPANRHGCVTSAVKITQCHPNQ